MYKDLMNYARGCPQCTIERFHLFMHLFMCDKTCDMADSTCCKEHPERYLQLSFEEKKSYITNLSLMSEIDPWDLLKGGSSQDSV